MKELLEYIGGSRDTCPQATWFNLGSPLWGLWWGGLVLIVYVFAGQSSKFIYIDF